MQRKNGSFIGIILILTMLPGVFCGADDWPAWRGAERDGKSAEKDLLKTWPEGGPKRLWALPGIGSGYSTVSVVDGVVYTTGHKNGRLILHAISSGGKFIWSKDIGAGFVAKKEGTRSTPTYDNGNLYVESGVGLVGCYDAKDGSVKWTRDLIKDLGGKVPNWGYAESVLILGDLAIVTPGASDCCMAALNKKTGETVWKSPGFSGAQYSSPLYVEFQGVPMIVNGTKGGILAVHAKTGAILWSNDFSARNTANCPTPAYSNGYIFWANGYGKGAICLKLQADGGGGVKAVEAWRSKDMVCHHGGYIILDGYVYGNHSGGVTCLELATGEKKWFEKAVGKGSLTYADGMLFLFGEKGGKAGLGPASPGGFSLKGEVSVQGSGPSWAYPVVAQQRLFLRYDDNLYCYDVKG